MRTTAGGQSALLLLDVAHLLNEKNIDFVVIGAFALAALAAARGTKDCDALLSLPPQQLTEIRQVFEAADFNVVLRYGDMDDSIPAMLVLTDAYGNCVELLAGLRHLDPQVFSRALTTQFMGETLKIVGREDFIALKCFAGNPQDLIDATSAYVSSPGPIDLDLIRTVTRRFGREAADNLDDILSALSPPKPD